MIREALSEADLGAYTTCWSEVWPDDPISTDFVLERISREPERRYLLAEVGGAVVGTGCVVRSSQHDARPTIVAVLPSWRRRGLGSALLERCLDYARTLQAAKAIAFVREDDDESLAFGERRGFVVTDRVVSLALDLDPDPPAPVIPPGIEITELDDTGLEEAYEVFAEGAADIPAVGNAGDVSPFDEWVLQFAAHPLTLVALDGGRVVGYADLELRNAEQRLLDNNLTTVRRSHRGRGIAEALKRTQIGWATEHGYRRVVTATHAANEPMRRLNEKLGYHELPAQLDLSLTLDADGR